MQESVLTILANKEKVIEALRRELAEKKNAFEILEQREGKLKGHVFKLKAMIQPLGDELVSQKKELDQVKLEAALQKGAVETRNEELVEKCMLIDQKKDEVAALETKLKDMGKRKDKAIEVEKEKLKAMEEKLKEAQEKVKRIENKVKNVEEARMLLEVEKLQLDSNVVASEQKAQELEEKLHQTEERAVVLNEQLQKQALELGQLRKVEDGLRKFEEMLAFVKADCAEVKRDNRILEENLKKKQKQLKSLKKKLSQTSKSMSKKKQVEEGEENGKKRKLKQDQGKSVAKQAKVVQSDISKEGNNPCLKVEASDLQVNLSKEKTGAADEAGAEKVEVERESQVLENDVPVSISDDEVLYISDEEAEQPQVSQELGETVLAEPPAHDPSYGTVSSLSHTSPSTSSLSQTSPSTSGLSQTSSSAATPSSLSFSPLDISGSPPQLQSPNIPPLSEPLLRLRDLKSLVESPSQQSAPTESKTDRIMSLKHEMKHQVELVLRKHYHKAQPHVYGQRSWEIFDDEDFAEVCRMLAVQAREEVLRRWGLQGDSKEDLWILEEDIARMRGNVDYFFYMRKVKTSYCPFYCIHICCELCNFFFVLSIKPNWWHFLGLFHLS